PVDVAQGEDRAEGRVQGGAGDRCGIADDAAPPDPRGATVEGREGEGGGGGPEGQEPERRRIPPDVDRGGEEPQAQQHGGLGGERAGPPPQHDYRHGQDQRPEEEGNGRLASRTEEVVGEEPEEEGHAQHGRGTDDRRGRRVVHGPGHAVREMRFGAGDAAGGQSSWTASSAESAKRRADAATDGGGSGDVAWSELGPSPPNLRSRRRYSVRAASRSAGPKSGQSRGVKKSSAYAHSQSRKSLSRCSPPVRIRRSTSGSPPVAWIASAISSANAARLGGNGRRQRPAAWRSASRDE